MMKSVWKEPTNKSAFVLSLLGTIIEIIFAVIGLVYYAVLGSALSLVFGLENLVDCLSSVVVLWRFFAPGTMTKERERTLKRRELRASMAISFILILLGLGVIATSSFDIATGSVESVEIDIVVYISLVSVFVFGTLTAFKFQYANKLKSESLYKDGICSLIGTILASALFANTLIIKSRPDIWWLDPFVAMVCGFAALYIGIHSVFVAWKFKRTPIFSLSWWLMSRGSATDNASDGNEDGKPTVTPQNEKTIEMNEQTNLSGEVV